MLLRASIGQFGWMIVSVTHEPNAVPAASDRRAWAVPGLGGVCRAPGSSAEVVDRHAADRRGLEGHLNPGVDLAGTVRAANRSLEAGCIGSAHVVVDLALGDVGLEFRERR